MTEQIAINVDRVGKKFARSLKRSMTYGLVDIAKATMIPRHFRSPNLDARLSDALSTPNNPASPMLRGAGQHSTTNAQQPTTNNQQPPSGLRPTEFWAVRDVSLQIRRGESVGLVGANGAGKSTLFSILSGIYGPTEGRVEVRGRLQALIALGAGFHPTLSGRENIYINAAILGLDTKTINEKLEGIIEFSGIREFIDAPVKKYSSGMLVRLGFSIAVHVDPDILLIDEVLAVGDAAFQRKCMQYSLKLARSGKTIVTVSHNHLFIQSMCERIIWLDHGKVVADGPTDEVLDEYRKFMAASATSLSGSKTAGMPLVIHGAEWKDAENRTCEQPPTGENISLEIDVEALEEVDCARIWIQLHSVDRGEALTAFSMYDDGHYLAFKPGRAKVTLRIPELFLGPGTEYRISVGLRDWACAAKLSDSYSPKPFTMSGEYSPCENGVGAANKVAGSTSATLYVPYGWESSGSVELRDDSIGEADDQ